jgi:hypothetical protein
MGWALAFGRGSGILITVLLIPPLIARTRSAQRLLSLHGAVRLGTPPFGLVGTTTSPLPGQRAAVREAATTRAASGAADSPLEGGGFELPVSGIKRSPLQANDRGVGAFERTVCGWDRKFESPLLQR